MSRLAIIISLVVVAFAGCGTIPAIDVELERGRQSFLAGDCGAALKSFYRALRMDPTREEALLGHASIVHFQKRYERAAELYQRVLDQHPDNREAKIGKLRCVEAGEGISAALEVARELRLEDSGSALLLTVYGRLLLEAGRESQGLELLYRAVTLDRGSGLAAFVLAKEMIHEQKWEEAFTYAKTSADVDPQAAEWNALAGACALRLSRNEDAEKYLGRAILLQCPDPGLAWLRLGQARQRMGRPRDALFALWRAEAYGVRSQSWIEAMNGALLALSPDLTAPPPRGGS